MYTLWVSLITVALLAGSATGAMAKEEDGASTTTFVTGRIIADDTHESDWEEG